MFEQVPNAADWVMFTIEDCEVYDKIVKVRSFKHCPWPDPTLRSDWLTGDVSSVSRFLRWQLLFLATIGFCHYLHRLADKFPPPLISPIDIGPGTEQLLENKEDSIKEAAGKNDKLDKENAGLRAKVDFLQKDATPSSAKSASSRINSTRGRNSGSSTTNWRPNTKR